MDEVTEDFRLTEGIKREPFEAVEGELLMERVILPEIDKDRPEEIVYMPSWEKIGQNPQMARWRIIDHGLNLPIVIISRAAVRTHRIKKAGARERGGVNATRSGFPIEEAFACGDYGQVSTWQYRAKTQGEADPQESELDGTTVVASIVTDGISTAQLNIWREWVMQPEVMEKLRYIFGEDHPVFQCLNPDTLYAAFMSKYPIRFNTEFTRSMISMAIDERPKNSFKGARNLKTLIYQIKRAISLQLLEFRNYLGLEENNWCNAVYSLTFAIHSPGTDRLNVINMQSSADTVILTPHDLTTKTNPNTNGHFDKVMFAMNEALGANAGEIPLEVLAKLYGIIDLGIDTKSAYDVYGSIAQGPDGITHNTAMIDRIGSFRVVQLTDGGYKAGDILIRVEPEYVLSDLEERFRQGELGDDAFYLSMGDGTFYFPYG